ncbi:unnamed protein product, partial [Vitis vinifera]
MKERERERMRGRKYISFARKASYMGLSTNLAYKSRVKLCITCAQHTLSGSASSFILLEIEASLLSICGLNP